MAVYNVIRICPFHKSVASCDRLQIYLGANFAGFAVQTAFARIILEKLMVAELIK
jgi:hypothetical protein